jgi:hypothetical protein
MHGDDLQDMVDAALRNRRSGTVNEAQRSFSNAEEKVWNVYLPQTFPLILALQLPTTSSPNLVKPFIGLVFLLLIGLLYQACVLSFLEYNISESSAQNSETVKDLLSPSIPRPEEWDPTPGAQGPVDFSVDVAKRDAVVEAFKVLIFVHFIFR